VRGEPGGQLFLGQGAIREVEIGQVGLPFWHDNVPSVEIQNDERDHHSAACSVDESVIPSNPEDVGRGQTRYVRIVGDVERFCQGGITEGLIADAFGTVVFGKLLIMLGYDGSLRAQIGSSTNLPTHKSSRSSLMTKSRMGLGIGFADGRVRNSADT
jgi:hypothetical protein